jgi:hypothetical protein
MRWRPFFLGTSLGKRCTSYNPPPTSRKRGYGRCKRTLFRMEERPLRASALRDWKVAMDALTEIGGTPLDRPPYSQDLATWDFWTSPTTKRELRGQNRPLHYPSEACGKRSAVRFREVGGAFYEVHRLPREVLRRRDSHRTSTKFWLGVIRWVHELCKTNKYSSFNSDVCSMIKFRTVGFCL